MNATTPPSGGLVLVRHGATRWSLIGRHTGRTDLPLEPEGILAAKRLAPRLAAWAPTRVWCSPLQRARDTAAVAGLVVDEFVDDLMEWDYGDWEGLTTSEIRESTRDPQWSVWRSTPPGPGSTPGESLDDVARRADRVVARTKVSVANGERVVLVAHGHLLRVLTARWLGLDSHEGKAFRFETAGTATLGFERETPVIVGWDGGLSSA